MTQKNFKVLEVKGLDRGKVSSISDGETIISVPKKKTYKQYLKEVSKLNF